MNCLDKYEEMKELIKEIFYGHHGRYSYRNIILEIQNLR